MKATLTALLCASALGVVAAPALAQPYPPRAVSPAAVPGHDFREQLETLENRLRDGQRDGTIDRGEYDRANRELASIRDQARELRERSGGELTDMQRGMIQQRIDQLARSIHWMRENDRDHMGPPPPPPAPPGGWSLEQREDWLQQRIERGRADGSLDRREAYRAERSLRDIRAMQARLLRRDRGRLTDADRLYLEQRLDRLRDGLRWMRQNSETAPWARP